jgi:hypothetical protein
MPIQRSATSQSSTSAGPRTQCDQIIYEAMVKACEIVVRGRCDERTLDPQGDQSRGILQRQHSDLPSTQRSNYGSSISQQQQNQNQAAASQRGTNNSRFNLEIAEVPSVRQILSTWRQALHLPLRLDIYHEHYEDAGLQQPQRELLERWCFDYTPENNGHVSLRTVCQRIVCALRSLHCLMRVLPANNGEDCNTGFGVARNVNVGGTTTISGSGSRVGYSIYTTEGGPCALPSPSFAQKDLPSISTGYGSFSMSVMYDATLQMRSEPIPILAVQRMQQPVGAQIIKDYHSPPLQPLQSGGQGEKRVMSGLSLAMMGEEENLEEHQLQQQQYHHEQVGHQIDTGFGEDSLLPWGSPATRAAFHLPPAYREGVHSGYGYGYNGAQLVTTEPEPQHLGSGGENLSISPSPLISTPPQAMWGKPRMGEVPSSIVDAADTDEEGMAKPFTNPTSLQPSPSRSASQSASNFVMSSMGSSPANPLNLEKSTGPQRKRTSSSSSAMLPPVTSLDLLQKSPFSSKFAADTSGIERADSDGIAMPFILESYRDEMLTSSIPRMISADSRVRTSSIGGGSSSLLPSLGNLAISGGYHSTGPYASRLSEGHYTHNTTIDADEMPFAVDDDFPLIGSASSPFGAKSRSMWGSVKGEADGSTNVFSEVNSSLAVSSLHQRCAHEGKPRLKLFESAHSLNITSKNSDVDENTSNDYATIKEQLSDFRSFGASLMVGSTHDSCSE